MLEVADDDQWSSRRKVRLSELASFLVFLGSYWTRQTVRGSIATPMGMHEHGCMGMGSGGGLRIARYLRCFENALGLADWAQQLGPS